VAVGEKGVADGLRVKGDAPARVPTCEDSSTEKLGLWGGQLASWGWWLVDGG
jgi:hypothetical protein